MLYSKHTVGLKIRPSEKWTPVMIRTLRLYLHLCQDQMTIPYKLDKPKRSPGEAGLVYTVPGYQGY